MSFYAIIVQWLYVKFGILCEQQSYLISKTYGNNFNVHNRFQNDISNGFTFTFMEITTVGRLQKA